MAKVFLELESSAITDLTEEKIQKLESNNIPFEKDDKSIYLISKSAYESGVSVYSREYDKNYNKFCMQIADSTEGSIGLGEGADGHLFQPARRSHHKNQSRERGPTDLRNVVIVKSWKSQFFTRLISYCKCFGKVAHAL